MTNSMTGFGCATGEISGVRARLEIKTLNNRYREFVLRTPHFLGSHEEPLKKLINQRISRGRVELWLQLDLSGAQDAPELSLNLGRARHIKGLLEDLSEGLGLEGGVTLTHMLRLDQHYLSSEGPNALEGADPERIWSDLKNLAGQALSQLVGMRENAGAILKADISRRLDSMLQTHRDLKAIAANQPAVVTKRYQARLEELAETIMDPVRIAQEAAILAEKLDITEEITRFASHLKNFQAILDEPGPVGRRLEFLLQELLREANTMGSKSQSLPITELVLSFKSELEKIREQVLNVE
jgi:uncharacterized protein (TIGR00255 family)